MSRRLPFRVLDCLLLGVLSTVLTAWAVAIWAPGNPKGTPTFGSDMRYFYQPGVGTWAFTIERHAGRMDVVSGRVLPPTEDDSPRSPDEDRRVERSELPAWSAMATERAAATTASPSPPIPRVTRRIYHEYAYGWPLPALVERHQTSGTPTANKPWELHGSFKSIGEGETIPIRPLPFGLGIDIIAHALLWMIPLMLLGFARRALRKKRGRCPKCGYDLRASKTGVCPECGRNLVVREN